MKNGFFLHCSLLKLFQFSDAQFRTTSTDEGVLIVEAMFGLMKSAQQVAPTICVKRQRAVEEVNNNNYEEVLRSRPAQAAANLHT